MPPSRYYRLLDTRSLVKKCISNDVLAWAEFVRRFSPLIKNAVRIRLERHGYRHVNTEIDDIQQEVVLKLWQMRLLDQVKDVPKITCWLAMISANLASDYCRKAGRDIMTGALPIIDELADTHKNQIFPKILTSRDAREMLDADSALKAADGVINSLETRWKIAAKLNIYYGLGHSYIARLIKVPEGTVSSIIKRVKDKIKKIVQEKP